MASHPLDAVHQTLDVVQFKALLVKSDDDQPELIRQRPPGTNTESVPPTVSYVVSCVIMVH